MSPKNNNFDLMFVVQAQIAQSDCCTSHARASSLFKLLLALKILVTALESFIPHSLSQNACCLIQSTQYFAMALCGRNIE